MTENSEKNTHGDDDYFGVCPYCLSYTGRLDIGKGNWLYCSEHKIRWFIGTILTAHGTEAEQTALFDELDFGSYRMIREFHVGDRAIEEFHVDDGMTA
jgi:hypothetical protein